MRNLIKDQFTHQRYALVADGQGGFTKSLSTLTAFMGRLSRMRPAEIMNRGKQYATLTHKLYTDGTPDVQREDVVTLGSIRVRVVSVENPSQLGRHHEFLCEEIIEGV